MKIAVLGISGGARARIARLAGLGHEVYVGTRDPEATLARTEPDMMGAPPFGTWLAGHPGVEPHTFADAAERAPEPVGNGIDGHDAVAALSGPRSSRRAPTCTPPSASPSVSAPPSIKVVR
ncbi:hypothetical protein ACH4PU_21615 [Streptomyces sp. NPDC021100]|uniref:hypothetical protein n=1 Tax=Streptomyces sp. NPDC021100 TaxID=3365114 RepID=UPI0037A09959